jgi:hypothetical protein
MRLAKVVVALAAACDGNMAQTMVDSGMVDAAIEPEIDANLGINGTWRDTYIAATGTTMQPVCGTAPTAVVVDSTTAATTPYPGTCKGDGSFRINAPGNLGTYYLRVQGALYETTKHAGLDLSTDRLGRHDVSGITGVSLSFNMTNLESWSTGEVLMAFGANVGYIQHLAFATGGPTNNATSLSGTAPWNGYKIDASKQDALQIVQLSQHATQGGLAYLSLDRAFNVPAFTMTDNMTHNVLGAFYSPPAGTLELAVDAASFDAHRLAANPNTAMRTIAGTAYAAASPDVIASPSLISFARDSSTAATLSFGTLDYTDPFPASWTRFVKIQQAFQVPYVWNGVHGTYNATLTRTLTKADAETGAITAQLSPPRSPKFDSDDAFTVTNISPVPVVSWQAPELGTPTDYEIQVYEVQISGQSLKFISTLRLQTKQTSVRIPAGYLLGQRQYIFVIRARIRDTVDMYTTPLRAGQSSSSADVLTTLVTTDS